MGGLELCLFECWRLTRHGALVEFRLREQRLTALLALRGARSRSTIAGTLWPDRTEEKARTNLRAAVMRIRRWAPDALAVSGDTLGLEARVRVDVDEFLSTVRRLGPLPDRVTTAELLIPHTLLPDWDDDWLAIERERLQMIRLRCLERVARGALDADDPETAIVAAEQAIDIESLHEPAHALLIRAHLADGNGAAAVRQYQRLTQALASELGIAPSGRLTALVERAMPGVATRERARRSPARPRTPRR